MMERPAELMGDPSPAGARVEFAAQRRKELANADRTIGPAVRRALNRFGQGQWWDVALDAAETVYRRVFRRESHLSNYDIDAVVARFRDEVGRTIRRTHEPKEARANITAGLITRWLSTATVNAATTYAATFGHDMGKEWVTMHDNKVRPSHVEADGQVVPLDEKFHVDGARVDYPGQPVGEPALWINCRCVMRPVNIRAAEGGTMTAATDVQPEAPVEEDDYEFEPIPWHGVLAPEGVVSGDKRRFSSNALSWRDLPLPLAWQRVSDERHKGSVVVGQIQKIWRDGPLIKASGVWDQSVEADEAFRMVVDKMLRGVSVDVDDVTMEFQAENGTPASEGEGIATFTKGRICGATLVAIPAFQEAFIQIGEQPLTAAAIHEGSWDGSASNYTDEQYRRATVLDRGPGAGPPKQRYGLPIRTPNGTLSRAGVHAAAQRINSVKGASSSQIAAAKSRLRAAYRQLGEEPPDTLAITDPEEFGRGPGWVTNPAGTRRLHDYWVSGPGAAKIRWGEPRDFYRCRDQVGEEIGENSPAKLRFINQICAQWHHDAIGMWPGQEDGHRGNRGHHHVAETEEFCDDETCHAPAFALVAAATTTVTKRAEFFENPYLVLASPLVITREGRCFGHLATWGTCHIGIGNACVTAPRSATSYAYFHTGAVDLDDGRTIAVGHLTLGGGHADRFAGYRAAIEHYDDTGTCAADVVMGEDDIGIWFSGQVRPDLTDQQMAAFKAAPLSGDWRPIGGGLELVAALSVNVPGFPIPRAEMAIVGGHQLSLVAAGVVPPQPEVTSDPATLAAAIVDEMDRRQRIGRMAALRAESNRNRIAKLRS